MAGLGFGAIRTIARVAVAENITASSVVRIVKATGTEIAEDQFLGVFNEVKEATQVAKRAIDSNPGRIIPKDEHVETDFFTKKEYNYNVRLDLFDGVNNQTVTKGITVNSSRPLSPRGAENLAEAKLRQSLDRESDYNLGGVLPGRDINEVEIEGVQLEESYRTIT